MLSGLEAEESVTSRHFALLKGMPGHLQFTKTEVFFTSVRGFRNLSSKLLKKATRPGTPTTLKFRKMPHLALWLRGQRQSSDTP